ncbi:hypothetical protein BGZ47_008019 [Haplosporangium gracile]|nr:hypothetical protein BGZ47_008019 [Haplosporangium gracile]
MEGIRVYNLNPGFLSFSVLFVFLHFGGNYDPVEKGFTSDSSAFHMTILFFFFTVILMLNVLMGFRESHNYLPVTIYYERKAKVMEDEAPVTLNSEGWIQYLPEPTAPALAPILSQIYQLLAAATPVAATPVAATPAADYYTSPSKNDAMVIVGEMKDDIHKENKEEKQKEEKEGDASGVARLVEVELRKQLDVERANSEKQIGDLQQQLRDQQQMLV